MRFRWIALASLLLFALMPLSSAFAQSGEAVDCESHNFNRERCDVPWRDARLVRNYCRYKHAPQALPFTIQRCIRTTTAAEIARRYDAGDKAAQHVIDNAAAY